MEIEDCTLEGALLRVATARRQVEPGSDDWRQELVRNSLYLQKAHMKPKTAGTKI